MMVAVGSSYSLDLADMLIVWRQACMEASRVTGMDDPIARNRQITSLYAGLYLRNPELLWAGAAAFVSKDIGHEMGKFSTMTVWNALAYGNRLVFDDLYKYLRYYELMKERQGRGNLQGYADALPGVHPDLREGLCMLAEPGREQEAGFRLLRYEQQHTLQNNLYSLAWFRRNLDLIRWTGYRFASIKVCFNRHCADRAEDDQRIVFAPEHGDLYHYCDRIKFSNAIMDDFCARLDSPEGRVRVETELAALRDSPQPPSGLRSAWRSIGQALSARKSARENMPPRFTP